MQAYGQAFATVYNELWTNFANQVAPKLVEFYSDTPAGRARTAVLDLCCGTGQLARHFLDGGFPVVGIDLSEPMLHLARENNRDHVASGLARFVLGDAADFRLDEPVGLVVSTYDSLNHLDGPEALRSCFRSALGALADGGIFLFDMNTRLGLTRWNNMTVQEREDAVVITRGAYDGAADQALMTISGFIRRPDGLYERFEEKVFNSAFRMQDVRDWLLATGFQSAAFARVEDLSAPLDDPEAEGRVFIVARK